MSRLKITVLVDDHACMYNSGRGEHGFSALTESRDHNILFDTGASNLCIRNSRQFELEMFGVDSIVLSHNHYDHGNGLPAALTECHRAQLWLHQDAMNDKYAKLPDGSMVYAGLDEKAHKAIVSARLAGRVSYLKHRKRISPHHLLFSAGERKHLPPDWMFYVETPDGKDIPDTFEDEINLLIIGDHNSCLITGCAHVGLIKIFKTASKLTKRPVSMVVGGSHLDQVSNEEISEVADFFSDKDVKLYLGHCTGYYGFSRLYSLLGNQVEPVHVGFQLETQI